MTAPFMYNFRSVSNKFPTIFLSLISHFSPQVRLFLVEKGKYLKFSDSKCDGEKNQKNSHFRKT